MPSDPPTDNRRRGLAIRRGAGVGVITFGLIRLFFTALAAYILGLTTFAAWISQIVSFLPLLIADW